MVCFPCFFSSGCELTMGPVPALARDVFVVVVRSINDACARDVLYYICISFFSCYSLE